MLNQNCISMKTKFTLSFVLMFCFLASFGQIPNQSGRAEKKFQNAISHKSSTSVAAVVGHLAGVVTDGVTNQPVSGALVQAGTYSTYTINDGAYDLAVAPGTYSISFSFTGYQIVTVSNQLVAGNTVVTVNAQLYPTPTAPACASILVDPNDAQCSVNWCVPNGYAELYYDDGSAENYAAWQMPGNMNAVKFTPQAYPLQVSGAKFFVGDGSFPVGGNFIGKSFAAMVVKADGPNEMPGTVLDSIGVIVNEYGWVTVDGFDADITSGSFFIVMVQLSQSPDCVPIGVDETVPKAYKSYSRNVGAGSAWVLSPHQDFMIRAIVFGAVGSNGDNPGEARMAVPMRALGMYSLIDQGTYPGMEATRVEMRAATGTANNNNLCVYELHRFVISDPNVAVNVAPNTSNVVLGNAIASTSYTDGGTAWAGLPQGWYAYGIRAVYPDGSKSDYTFTGLVPHKMNADITVNVKLACGLQVAPDANVQLIGQDYPNPTYAQVTSASGQVFFDNVVYGSYSLKISKPGYQDYIQLLPISANHTYEFILEENRYKPRNLFVDNQTLKATWDEPLAIALSEDFESTIFPPPGWQMVTMGSVGWYRSNATGCSYCGSMPHTFFALADDGEAGPTNNGCCDYLITPALDLTSIASNKLVFESLYTGAYGQMAYVEISTDDGATWTPIYTLAPTNKWVSVTVDLSMFSGPNGLSNVKFAFHADDGGVWASGWGVDDVIISSGAVPVNGYEVFLDGTIVGQTPVSQRTYTYNPMEIIWGQTYVAGVAGLYCSGYSELDTYTFTSEFLYPPRNLSVEPITSTTSGAAYLSWNEPGLGDMAVSATVPRTSMPLASGEYSPTYNQFLNISTPSSWDILLLEPLATTGHSGIETDGTNIYTSFWNGGGFSKFDIFGDFVEDFTIPGVDNIRDLAYNPLNNHYYGSDYSNTIYEIDFANKILVGSVNSPGSPILHISYSPLLDGGLGGFYVGDWTSLRSIKMNGDLIANSPGFPLAGAYGSACGYGDIWIFDQGGNGVDLVTFDPVTLLPTGFVEDLSPDIPIFNGGLAGGLALCQESIGNISWSLLGIVQQDFMFAKQTASACACPTLNTYNIYRNDSLIVSNLLAQTEYWDMNLLPGPYCYEVSAVYEMSNVGFPGTYAESRKEGPKCIELNYGYPLPFSEGFDSGQLGLNQWDAGPNWSIDGQGGAPSPSAKFTWDPLLTNYNSSLESFYLDGAAINTSTYYQIFCDFEVKLDDRTASNNEKLTLEVWNGSDWVQYAEFINNGDFDWTFHQVNISATAKNHVFKIRFRANGNNSSNINYWSVDNVHVYAQYLVEWISDLRAQHFNKFPPEQSYIKLTWSIPLGGMSSKTYSLDDNSFENGWGLNPGTEGWLGNQFSNTDQGKIQSADVYFMANGSSSQSLNIDLFNTSQTIIASSSTFIPPSNGWLHVSLPETDFAGNFYAMVHWNNVASASNWLGSDENGAYAINNLGWFYDGSAWAHLSDYGYAPNVFGIRINALVEGDHPVTYGPAAPGDTPLPPWRGTSSGQAGPIMPCNDSVSNSPGNTDDMIGFKIFRNTYFRNPGGPNTNPPSTFDELATVPVVSSYLDYDCHHLTDDCYEYYIKTVYDEGLSVQSNTAWDCIWEDLKSADQSNLTIYPNPATDFIRVESHIGLRSVQVYNSLGSILLDKPMEGPGQIVLSTSGFAAGVYTLKCIALQGETIVRDFVVVK